MLGKLFSALNATRDSEPVDAAVGIAAALATVVQVIGAIIFVPALVVLVVAVEVVAFNAVYGLAANHFAPYLKGDAHDVFLTVAPFSAGVTAGLPLLCALALVFFSKKLNMMHKGLATIVMIAWTIIVTLLSLYSSALDFNLLSVPVEVIGLASFIYAALPALALFPVGFGLAAAKNAKGEHYSSVFHASSVVIGVMLEAISLIAIIAAEAYFGIAKGLAATFVVPASLIAAFSFVHARGRYAASRKRQDHFDCGVWAIILVIFGSYGGLVTALSIQELSNGNVALFDPTWMKFGTDSYQLVMWLFLAATLAAEFLTRHVDSPGAEADGRGEALITGIYKARKFKGELKQALRAPTTRQLPAPEMAKAAPAMPTVKQSERGVPYDTTGELVVPEDPKAPGVARPQ